MVVVTCYLSCTIRRLAPDSDSSPHLANINTLMEQICHHAQATIARQQQDARASQKPYEDKLLVMQYDVQFPSIPKHALACSELIKTFNTFMTSRGQSETKFYYLAVLPDIQEDDLSAYFYDVELLSYSLGFMSNPVKFHTQFDYQQELFFHSQQLPKATFALDQESILINFAVSRNQRFDRVSLDEVAPETEVYCLSVDFKQLVPSILVNQSSAAIDLCFLTISLIQFWRTKFDVTNLDKLRIDKTNWVRAFSISSKSEISNQVAINKTTLGGCSALKLRLAPGKDVRSIIDSLFYWYKFNIYYTVLDCVLKEISFPEPPLMETPAAVVDTSHDNFQDKINWMLAALPSIGFRVRYQFKDNVVGKKFIQQVKTYFHGNRSDRQLLLSALSNTFDVLLNDGIQFFQLDRVLAHYLQCPKELDELVMNTQRLIKRMIITPTRVLLLAPSLIHDNRILRLFDADSAVSCSFQNDDMSSFGGVANTKDFVEEAIGSVLRIGVPVAGRQYEFLGCSGSQLKSNGCWLYAADSKGRKADDIRDSMPALSSIRNPATYLSRLGQCFSDTTAAELDWSVEITWDDEDVMGGADPRGNPYCFSDGVGTISGDCLKEVMIRMPTQEKMPSAFQVRLGGAKGMLCLDKRLSGKKILVRKSMVKFDSSIATVEVMRRTHPTPLFLNYQVITILSQLRPGIPDNVFIRLLNNMLHRLADVLLDDKKAVAALSQSGLPCCYAKLKDAGFHFTTDPFFKNLLKAITCARINQLKLKARIEIPHEYGRQFLGVMDEEGVLEYGEVFIRYSANIREPNVNPITKTGDVIVSKMPALHPGDVRKLTAVDRPELYHLVDCIVFPQKGPRPHPHEMAGSDLDGDEYWVTWHPDLIFPGANETPMDFPSGRRELQEEAVTVGDLVDFIVTYISTNRVGAIANTHTAWADKEPEGVHSATCKRLARLFCHVIDFSKTGYLPPEVTEAKIMGPKKYPDFMDKQDRPSYRSQKVLGKMFRINQRLEQSVMTIDKEDTERIRANWRTDERFLVPGYESYMDSAVRLYEIYSSLLDAEKRRHGIESEEELVSGCVIKIKGYYSNSEDMYDIEKRLQERMKDIRELTKNKFEEFLDQSEAVTELNRDNERMKFASACYVLTYRDVKQYKSFPWVRADVLLKILHEASTEDPGGSSVQLSRSINGLDSTTVERYFRFNGLSLPADIGMARIYYLLIHWGLKSKFLRDEANQRLNKTMTVEDFASIMDKVVKEEQDIQNLIDADCETGPLLCGILRGLTNFRGRGRLGDRVPRVAIIHMKEQILLIHHRLARDPRVECMQVQMTGINVHKTIKLSRERWDQIKLYKSKLKERCKEKYQVVVNCRRGRYGGVMHISGEDNLVYEFLESWYENELDLNFQGEIPELSLEDLLLNL